MMDRVQRIKTLRWEVDEQIPAEVLSNFSYKEGQFLNGYDKILSGYFDSVGIDLTRDCSEPPQELFVEVRVVKDCAVQRQGSDTLQLKSNTTHFLRRQDVESLIRTGYLEHVA